MEVDIVDASHFNFPHHVTLPATGEQSVAFTLSADSYLPATCAVRFQVTSISEMKVTPYTALIHPGETLDILLTVSGTPTSICPRQIRAVLAPLPDDRATYLEGLANAGATRRELRRELFRDVPPTACLYLVAKVVGGELPVQEQPVERVEVDDATFSEDSEAETRGVSGLTLVLPPETDAAVMDEVMRLRSRLDYIRAAHVATLIRIRGKQWEKKVEPEEKPPRPLYMNLGAICGIAALLAFTIGILC